MVSDQGLGLRHVEGYEPLRLAIVEHPQAARGITWWGGEVARLSHKSAAAVPMSRR